MVNVKSSSRYHIPRKKIKELVTQTLINRGLPIDWDINIIFVGKNKMRKISQTYKNENVALPVLSFFYNEKIEEKILLGEIFICYPQAVIMAAQRNKKVDSIILELVNHGLENLFKKLETF